MGFLNWIKDRSLTLEARHPTVEPPPPNFKQTETKRGNQIRSEYVSYWRKEDVSAAHKTRRHIGRSSEGLHGGLEITYKEGTSVLKWSNPRADIPSAQRAAEGMDRAFARQFKALSSTAPHRGQTQTQQRSLNRGRGMER